jgi:hypothetical protein
MVGIFHGYVSHNQMVKPSNISGISRCANPRVSPHGNRCDCLVRWKLCSWISIHLNDLNTIPDVFFLNISKLAWVMEMVKLSGDKPSRFWYRILTLESVWICLGVSKNGDTPKCIVKRKTVYKWMITRATPMTQETSIWICLKTLRILSLYECFCRIDPVISIDSEMPQFEIM